MALHRLLGAGVMGLGGGALARAILGVSEGLPPPTAVSSLSQSNIPTVIPIMIDGHEPEPQVPRRGPRLAKLSNVLAKIAAENKTWGRRLSEFGAQFVPDSNASNPAKAKYTIPMGFAMAGGGLYGGWKLVDWLLKRQRQTEVDQELEDAKQEYEKELLNEKTAAELDALYDIMEKRGDWGVLGDIANAVAPQGAKDLGHGLAGSYLTALMALTLGSGYGTYRWAKTRTDTELLRKALAARARQRRGPMPIMAIPVRGRAEMTALSDYEQAHMPGMAAE